jgi:hypothetical protein
MSAIEKAKEALEAASKELPSLDSAPNGIESHAIKASRLVSEALAAIEAEQPSQDAEKVYNAIYKAFRKDDISVDGSALIQSFADAQVAKERAAINELQKAHEEIGSLCFKAGIDTPDGSSVGAVRSLIEAFTRLKKRVYTLEKEITTPILVNTARLSDQLSKERERAEGLYLALLEARECLTVPQNPDVLRKAISWVDEALAKYQEEGE